MTVQVVVHFAHTLPAYTCTGNPGFIYQLGPRRLVNPTKSGQGRRNEPAFKTQRNPESSKNLSMQGVQGKPFSIRYLLRTVDRRKSRGLPIRGWEDNGNALLFENSALVRSRCTRFSVWADVLLL